MTAMWVRNGGVFLFVSNEDKAGSRGPPDKPSRYPMARSKSHSPGPSSAMKYLRNSPLTWLGAHWMCKCRTIPLFATFPRIVDKVVLFMVKGQFLPDKSDGTGYGLCLMPESTFDMQTTNCCDASISLATWGENRAQESASMYRHTSCCSSGKQLPCWTGGRQRRPGAWMCLSALDGSSTAARLSIEEGTSNA